MDFLLNEIFEISIKLDNELLLKQLKTNFMQQMQFMLQ
jgi:hypothetical protein